MTGHSYRVLWLLVARAPLIPLRGTTHNSDERMLSQAKAMVISMKYDELIEKELSSELIYSGKVAHLYKDTVELSNGHTAVREVLKHMGAVCVVPLNEKNEVVMVRQFRYPFNKVLLEIPAGKLERGEAPEDCARRELSEETGFIAKEFTYLGDFLPTVAVTDENIRIFLARGLTPGATHPDDDEFLYVEAIPLKTLVDMIMANEISDGKTQAAILKTWIYLNK